MKNHYWAHKSSGETFAVQVSISPHENGVASACGPLYYKEVTEANLNPWNFDHQPETATWINLNQNEFKLVEAPYAGDIAAMVSGPWVQLANGQWVIG